MDHYPIDVFWSDEDEGFIAVAKDLPGCSAFGSTREEASREIEDAIAAWIEAARNAGNPIPAPTARQEFSGKFLLRLPKTLHAELAMKAAAEGVSLNQYAVLLLSQRHTASEVAKLVVTEVTKHGYASPASNFTVSTADRNSTTTAYVPESKLSKQLVAHSGVTWDLGSGVTDFDVLNVTPLEKCYGRAN